MCIYVCISFDRIFASYASAPQPPDLRYTVAAPGFWFGGNLGQNFIHEFHSSHVLQWRRQNFGSERGDIQQKWTHQRLLKIFENFIK